MGSFVWPSPQYTRVTSPYGPRWGDFHSGVDLGGSNGLPIIAARPGTVIASEYHNSYGNYVKISHGGGISTLYAHASKLLVSVGKNVVAGEKIALVGSTGNSTGPHLHFEVRENNSTKNPLNYVSDKDTISNYTGPGSFNALPAEQGRGGTGGSPETAAAEESKSQAKEITEIVVKSTTGKPGAYRLNALRETDAILAAGCEILIQEDVDKIHAPLVEGEITLEYDRKGSPGTLTFNVLKEGSLSFQEGNSVSFRVDGKRIFYGYVFTKKRNKDGIITVTCYDQLRYLKNEDSLIYKNKKYSELLKMIADLHQLKTGTIEDTKFVIEARIEEGSMFDILGNASDETVLNTGELFVLYDDCGEICLKNIKNMLLPILIDDETAENFDYTSTIDEQSYDRIKLARDNTDTGQRELYVANDEPTQSKWGILQYYENTGSIGSTSTSSPNNSASGGEAAGGDTANTGMSTEKRTMGSAGINLVKEFEGVYLYAYRDPVGVWTIGYGHTNGVYAGQSISQAQAEAFLQSDMAEFEGAVMSRVKVPITQNMFDALVSFSFNVGAGALGSSDLLKKLNAGDYTGAANEFGRWVYGGGQQLPGLVRRRAAEKKLFLTGYVAGGNRRSLRAAEDAGSKGSNTADSAVLEEKAKLLLAYYGKKTRSLEITGCFGDVSVRGGSTVAIALDIGDIVLQNYMVVEHVKHRFAHMRHTMDLTVVGVRGEFI